jgi:predicted nucleic acid-binding protein
VTRKDEQSTQCVVVHANVVAKWFSDEPSSDRARTVLDSALILAAPDLLVAELGSIFREKVRSGELTAVEAARAIEVVMERVLLIPAEDGFFMALDIATTTPASFYDALYIALARTLQVELVTADGGLIRTLSASFGDVLRPLEKYES